LDGVHDHVYKILQCPSDPSNVANEGLVYGRYWGSTNYVANWFAWGNGKSSYNTPPQRFLDMTDGTSQTILFGEQYAQCHRLGPAGADRPVVVVVSGLRPDLVRPGRHAHVPGPAAAAGLLSLPAGRRLL